MRLTRILQQYINITDLIKQYEDDATVRLWDTRSGVAGRVLTGHTGPVESIAFSPDGCWTASVCSDGKIQLWEVDAGVLKAEKMIAGPGELQICVLILWPLGSNNSQYQCSALEVAIPESGSGGVTTAGSGYCVNH
ncbi:hypothetical protein K457DRAFT_13598 [Linnemannia elongata AG-77]|uniref:Uncharacterized protein n=1 Tax=Linnemannia elongata AG-77 TaxID=1314771 RepID=A0A197KEB8_9FUNG|nr:hypothetical protein K457DRAFT_13598 [Linnemannia elongata AG-77]